MFCVKVLAIVISMNLLVEIAFGMSCDSTPTVNVSEDEIVNINWYLFREMNYFNTSNCSYISITRISNRTTSGALLYVYDIIPAIAHYYWLSYSDGVLVYQLNRTDPLTINDFKILVFENLADGKYMAISLCTPGNSTYSYLAILSTNRNASKDAIESINTKMNKVHDGQANEAVNQNNCNNYNQF